jgi:hypothetical protein
LKPVGKALRDVKLMLIVFAQFKSSPLAVRGRSDAEIDDDIPNRAALAAYKLNFRVRGALKVHAPHRSAQPGARGAVLHKVCHQTAAGKFALAELSAKRAALVFEWNRLDKPGAVKVGFVKEHLLTRSVGFS